MKKNLTLIAYEIEAGSEAIHDLNLPARVFAALEASANVGDRALQLNGLDIQKESDFVAYYRKKKATLFGCLVRMKAGDATHIFTDQMNRKVLDIADLVAESQTGIEGFIKDTTYFLMDKKHLILKSGHVTKKAVSTYFNWLLNKPDGNEEICRLVPKLSQRESVKLADVRSVEVSEARFANPEFKTVQKNLGNVKDAIFQQLIADSPDLKGYLDEELVSASIQLHFHIRRSKKDGENASVLQALLSSTDSADIKISLKDGGTIVGSTFEEKRSIEIDISEKALLNDQELEQEMGKYARELG